MRGSQVAVPSVGDIGRSERKHRGDFPTPPDLVDLVVANVMPDVAAGAVVRVVDPACGDGRFLAAAAAFVVERGATPELVGLDLDGDNVAAARRALGSIGVNVGVGDALSAPWEVGSFDVVLGNPPYLSQLAAETLREADRAAAGAGRTPSVAAEFLDLALDLARPNGGRVGLVLPQSILASRDVGAIRRRADPRARRIWSWWSPERRFDAEVLVCALGFERAPDAGNLAPVAGDRNPVWTDVIVASLGVPAVPALDDAGTVGDRARCTAGFRDHYYGLVPAVGDHADGPRLVTSGSIDPLDCRWGSREVRFAHRRFAAPRVDVGALAPPLQDWAAAMSTPKVLVGNQGKILECVVDADGTMLPGVPVVTARPVAPDETVVGVGDADRSWEIAAVLTSPVASAWVWHRAAGTGLSANSVRVGPALLASVPWPAGPLDDAVAAARRGDVASCGRLIDAAFGIGPAADDLFEWWWSRVPARR